MSKKYHQLNLEQRSQIAALKRAGFSDSYIAGAIGTHRCTVGRELRRNSSSKGSYAPSNAHLYAKDRKADKLKKGTSVKRWSTLSTISYKTINGRQNKSAGGVKPITYKWLAMKPFINTSILI